MAAKKDRPVDWKNLTEQEKMKYEIAGELGLLDQVMREGWKSLSSKETGRIGGLMTKKRRQEQKKSISLVSAEIGMTKSMWADLERGIKDPQLSTIIRMAEGMNITASQIIIDLEKQLGKNFTLID